MQAFDYAQVHSVDEAVKLLAEKNGQARVLAGGTDLLVALREGRLQTSLVVDVKGIPELTELRYDPTDGLTLGAAVPCYRLYQNETVASAYPGLMDAAHLIGGIQIQGRASFGGNICNASPAADSIPTLIAHAAVCTVAGPRGRRQVAVEEFCVAPGRTVLEQGEFLVSIHVPAPQPSFGAAYLRFIPRNEMDIAVVGVGAALRLDAGRTRVEAARIALAAVAPTPLFVAEAGEALVGRTLDDSAIDDAAQIAQAAARPISDMRGTVEFRRHLVRVLTRRALQQARARVR